MPALLVGGEPKVEPKIETIDPAELCAKLTAMNAKTWKKIRDELLSHFPNTTPESTPAIEVTSIPKTPMAP